MSVLHIMWYPTNPSRDTLRVKISTIDKECRFPLFDQIHDSILKFQFKTSGWSLLQLNNYFTNTYFQHFSNTNLTTTSPNFCHFGLTITWNLYWCKFGRTPRKQIYSTHTLTLIKGNLFLSVSIIPFKLFTIQYTLNVLKI